MINCDYSGDELKKAMLNEACPNMEGYYSDLYDDFKELDKMEVGQTAQWFYRKFGTSLRMKDDEDFQRNEEFWRDQIIKSFSIIKTGIDTYSVEEQD